MVTSKKKFTKREDNKIIKEISQNSENISYCFTRLSTDLHRTEHSIRNRYYAHLRPKMMKDPKKAAFILGDKKKLNPGVKVVPRGKEVGGITINADKLKRVLESIFSILAE